MRRNLALAFLLAVVAAPYLPALRYGFVYDDHGAIEENAFLEDPAHLVRVVTLQTLRDRAVLDGQRPVLLLTHFAERAVWGLNPLGYHLTNLLLHLAAVYLLFRLSSDLGLARPWLAALLFGLHPVLAEAVQVPSFREDLLVTVFGLAYLRSARRWSSLVWLAVALLSKESAVVLPGLAAAREWLYPEKKDGRTARLAAAALLAVLFLVGVQSGRGLQAVGAVWNGYSLQPPRNFIAAPDLFLEYLRLLLVPWPLIADRVFDAPASWISASFAMGSAAVIAAGVLAWLLRKDQPAMAFGWLWMLAAFLPVSNLVPLFNPMADRYLYFMAPGFALLLAAGLRPVPGLALAVVYAGLTFHRLGDWKDDYTLWMKTGRQEPRSARARVWVGLELKKRGHPEVAARHFRDADRINPQDVTALINLAILDGESGDLAGAEEKLREAIRRRPDKRAAYANLAVALDRQGRTAEAEAARRDAERLAP